MEKLIQINVRLSTEGGPSTASDWPFRPINFVLSMFAHAGVVCALAYLPPGAAQAENPIHATVYKVIELKKTKSALILLGFGIQLKQIWNFDDRLEVI